jgi:hypothetical protein
MERWGGQGQVSSYLSQERGLLYTAVAAIYGALLGFLITSISIVITAVQSPRFDAIREGQSYGALWRSFFSAIRYLGTATVLSIACLLVDTDSHPNIRAFEVLLVVSLVSTARLSRSVSLLRAIVANA